MQRSPRLQPHLSALPIKRETIPTLTCRKCRRRLYAEAFNDGQTFCRDCESLPGCFSCGHPFSNGLFELAESPLLQGIHRVCFNNLVEA